MKKILYTLIMILAFASMSCTNVEVEESLDPDMAFEAQEWFDYFDDEDLPWDDTKELSLDEFPDVTFVWSPGELMAGDKSLFHGMPIWNVYLTDLTLDGKPEFCATVSFGSGVVDNRVIVYDYVTDKTYILTHRMYYDYHLSMDNGKVMVTQTKYREDKPLATEALQLVDGAILEFGEAVEMSK